MTGLLSSFYRALAGLLHPRVWWLTAAPFFMSALIWGLLFWYGWEWAVARTQQWLGQWALGSIESALAVIGLSGLHLVLAPFLVVALVVPLIVATVLAVIGATSMPAIVSHLGRRRFPTLARRHGGGLVGSVLHSLSVTAIFLVLMAISLPLWLIPPFVAILPPLLWGWLTYRVMSYDALAEHATPDERRRLIRRHRWPLVTIGIITGLLGAVPATVWASSLITVVLFPVVLVFSVWLYVLIFVFSGLWFTHYCLAALTALRADDARPAPL